MSELALIIAVLSSLETIGKISERIRRVFQPTDMEHLYNKVTREIGENGTSVLSYTELYNYCQSEEIRMLARNAVASGYDSELRREIKKVGGAKAKAVIAVLEEMTKRIKKEFSISDEMILEAIRGSEKKITKEVREVGVEMRTKIGGIEEKIAVIAEGIKDIPDIKEYLAKQDNIGKELKIELEGNLRRAKELTDRGEYDEAKILLETLGKHLTKLSRQEKGKYYNILCCIFVGLRYFPEALANVERALEYEDLLKYKLNKAICKMAIEEDKDLEVAKKILDSVTEGDRTTQYYTTLGHYFFEKGEYDNAEKTLAEALKTDPDSVASRFNYAGTFLKRLDFTTFDREIAWVRSRVEQGNESKITVFHYNYGMAFRFLLEATQDKPVLKEARPKKVYISGGLLEFSKFEKELLNKSISHLDIASEFASGLDQADVSINKSYCLFLVGRYESAKILLEHIEKKELPASRRRVVLSNLGDTYRVLSGFDNAVEIYQKAIDEFEPTYDNRLFLGMAYLGFGAPEGPILKRSRANINKGIEIFEELNDENPDDLFVKNNLGVVYSTIGRHDEAIRLFGEIENVDGKTDNVLVNSGTAYFRKGYYRKAFLYYSELRRKFAGRGIVNEELECFLGRSLANHVLTPGEEYGAGDGILVTAIYAREVRRKDFKCRNLLATKLLEKIDESVQDYEKKLYPLLVLSRLYKYNADLETQKEKAHKWYEKAIELVERLGNLTGLPAGLKPQLDVDLKEYVEKRYGIGT